MPPVAMVVVVFTGLIVRGCFILGLTTTTQGVEQCHHSEHDERGP